MNVNPFGPGVHFLAPQPGHAQPAQQPVANAQAPDPLLNILGNVARINAPRVDINRPVPPRPVRRNLAAEFDAAYDAFQRDQNAPETPSINEGRRPTLD